MLSADDTNVLEEAIEAVPALFAEPGDEFVCEGEGFIYYTCTEGLEDTYLEYVGRNELPSKNIEFRGDITDEYKSPKKGWLVFKDKHEEGKGVDRCRGGLRDALGAWPMDCYSQHGEDGKVIRETLCIPAEDCGLSSFPRPFEFGADDEEEQLPPRPVKRLADCVVSKVLLHEVKMAVPALFAKPGDLFSWHDGASGREKTIVEYVGRNETPPESTSRTMEGDGDMHPLGWLVFRDHGQYSSSVDKCPGIRDVIDARRGGVYYLDQNGREANGTLCIPPKKCGALKVYKYPKGYWEKRGNKIVFYG